jgi:hypothetical protein
MKTPLPWSLSPLVPRGERENNKGDGDPRAEARGYCRPCLRHLAIVGHASGILKRIARDHSPVQPAVMRRLRGISILGTAAKSHATDLSGGRLLQVTDGGAKPSR